MYGKIAILLQIVKPTIRASWPNVQFKYLFYEFNRNEIKGISLDLFTLCAWLTSSEARNLTHKYWFNVENHKYFIHIYRWARMDEDYRSPWCIDSVDLAYIMLPALHQPHYCLLNISSAFFLYLQNHIDNAFCFAVSSWIGLRMKRKSCCTTPTQTHTHNSIRQCVCVFVWMERSLSSRAFVKFICIMLHLSLLPSRTQKMLFMTIQHFRLCQWWYSGVRDWDSEWAHD